MIIFFHKIIFFQLWVSHYNYCNVSGKVIHMFQTDTCLYLLSWDNSLSVLFYELFLFIQYTTYNILSNPISNNPYFDFQVWQN